MLIDDRLAVWPGFSDSVGVRCITQGGDVVVSVCLAGDPDKEVAVKGDALYGLTVGRVAKGEFHPGNGEKTPPCAIVGKAGGVALWVGHRFQGRVKALRSRGKTCRTAGLVGDPGHANAVVGKAQGTAKPVCYLGRNERVGICVCVCELVSVEKLSEVLLEGIFSKMNTCSRIGSMT